MKIFVSYARVDEHRVRELVDILRDSEHEPWFDHLLHVGGDWQNQLLEAIRGCDRFLYALTPESVASRWCQWEFAQAVHAGKPIVPVMIQAKTDLPEVLARVHHADFTKGPTGRAVAKLLAGILTAQVIPTAQVPLPETPHDEPERPIDRTRHANPVADQLYHDAYAQFLAKQYAEALELLHDCLLIAPQHVEAQTLLGLVERRAGRKLLIPVTEMLPSPFAWIEIPAGIVALEDASDRGGTTGGRFKVRAFSMAKYPITNTQYQVFVEASDGYHEPRWWEYSEGARQWRAKNPTPTQTRFTGGDVPRTNISWYEAVAFCRWLSEKSGEDITLPTEQQWQRAAQGDDGRVYPWGNEFDVRRCNTSESRMDRPTPVMHYPGGASPFGVMDMSGNVWEWCLTAWDSGTSSLRGTGARALRGGSLDLYPDWARCTSRYTPSPFDLYDYFGFRIVRRPAASH